MNYLTDFSTYITEKYHNLFSIEDKELYAKELFDMLTNSYRSIGGIKGSGFSSPSDIIENIPFIKIVKKNGEIVCASFYKYKDGRKCVAIATNGTKEGRYELKQIMVDDFERSYIEVSHASLRFMEREFPELVEKYKIPNDTNLKIFNNIERIDDYYYKRKIGDIMVTKLALGTPYMERL